MLLRPQSSRRIPRHDCVQRCRHLCYFWKGIATKNHAKWMIYRRLDWKNIGDASLRIPQRCYFLWFCLMMNSWLCIFVKIVWFCLRDNSFLHARPQYKLSPNYIFLWFCLRVTSFLDVFLIICWFCLRLSSFLKTIAWKNIGDAKSRSAAKGLFSLILLESELIFLILYWKNTGDANFEICDACYLWNDASKSNKTKQK